MSKGRTKALAAFLINLSSGWFGLILITPAISPTTLKFLDLTQALIWGILSFELSVKLEELLLS